MTTEKIAPTKLNLILDRYNNFHGLSLLLSFFVIHSIYGLKVLLFGKRNFLRRKIG